MRVENVCKFKEGLCGNIQILPSGDSSCYIKPSRTDHALYKELKQRLKYFLATHFLKSRQASICEQLRCEIPFRYDLLCLGQRFGNEASLREFLRLTGSTCRKKVLVVGCGYGDGDVQFWLQRRVKKLVGIDICNFGLRWQTILKDLRNRYDCEIEFRQATVECIPFESESFDLISSAAVLEHVQNLDLAVREMARVLAPQGWAWHRFGPLYFCHGGDHCMPAYGNDRGYDHLLMDEDKYQTLIHNQTFFDTTDDRDQSYWAKVNQFSFLFADDYIDIFSKYFHVEHVLVKISPSAIAFRDTCPDRWRSLLHLGIRESSLLVQSLAVVLRKKP